jgi:type IV pilus assembly protein PilA
MLKQLQKRKSEGFTIIEVLIVLAIAGLIMVVVFLAVPALQRSGRNNALNTDANNTLTAVGNYVSNNNGTLPTAASLAANTIKISGPAGSNAETAKVDSGTASVTFYSGTQLATTTAGAIMVVTGKDAQCNSTASGLAAVGGAGTASPRSYAVLYVAESVSGNILKCVGA